MMHIRIVLFIVGALFSAITIELVRRKVLRPEYALLWTLMSVLTLLLAAFPQLIGIAANITGIDYRTVLIVMVFLFGALMFMNYSVIVSRQSGRIVRLTQEIALLQHEVERLRNERKS